MKYQSQGPILGASPYGSNVLPQGLFPSESVVYSQGADAILDQKNEEVEIATQHLNEGEQFNYEQEMLLNQRDRESQTGSMMSSLISGLQKKQGINAFKPTLPKGYGPVDTTVLSTEPSSTFGSGIFNTPSSPNAPVQSFDDFAQLSSGPEFGVDIIGQDLSTNIQPRTVQGIDTSQNLVSNTVTTPGRTAIGQLLKPDKFNPGVTALAGTAAAFGGDAIRNAADDNDATTLNAGETAGTLIGSAGRGAGMASLAATLAPALAVPGLGWAAAGIGALVGGISALRRRRKARKEQRSLNRENKRLKQRQREAQNAAQIAGINTLTYTGQDTGRAITSLGRNTNYLKLGGTPYNYV